MKKDKNNKTFSERFEELCKNSILEIEDYENDKNNIKQFFISELKDIDDEIEENKEIEEKKESDNVEDLLKKGWAIGFNEGLNQAQQIIKKRI